MEVAESPPADAPVTGSASGPPGGPLVRAIGSWWLITIVVLVVYLVSPVRSATTHDPDFVPMTAHSIVHHASLAIDGFGAERLVGHPLVVTDGSLPAGTVVTDPSELRGVLAHPGVHVLDYFPWTSALFAVPAVVATDAVSAVLGTPDSGELIRRGDFELLHTASASVVVLGAMLLVRATALLVLQGPLGRRRIVANGVALVFALGTSAWSTASRALWQHTPSLLMLTLTLYLAVRIDRREPQHPGPQDRRRGVGPPDRWVIALGAAAVGAAVVRPTNLAFAVLILGWVLVRRRDEPVPTLVAVAIGAAAAVAVFVGAGLLLAGEPIPAYYSSGRLVLGGWFPEAVAANWVSPSRGLLVASPVLVLSVPGSVLSWRDPERRSLVVALWLSVGAVTVSVSAFPHWWAGHSFGPRFMTEAVPQLFVLALPAVGRLLDPTWSRERPARARAAVAAVVVLSLWSIAFHAVGATAGAAGCWNIYPDDVDEHPGRVWSVTDSQVLEPVHRLLDGTRRRAENEVCESPARTGTG